MMHSVYGEIDVVVAVGKGGGGVGELVSNW